MLVSIWYNPKKNSFYIKVLKSMIFDKQVGYINQFDHHLIQLLFVNERKFIDSDNFWDYYYKTHRKNKETTIITGILRLLYKLKRKER